ncbi:hypothetical protein [Jannaschia sp. W003]|uniref:hypothetical protein n=1 Tax=Jannaschia sp. W003 TaxID=2867012 RepID=UPI0021A28D95|nr:hypothetical protein [Jannaschia sp. W003]UWQ22140.1 hypothetical protein K3554_03665 [Jannaschia sp. W003]
MLGWKLFVRAVTLVTDHLPAALRLSLLPYAAVVLVDAALTLRWPEAARNFDPATPPPAGFGGASLLALVVSLAASLWIAVNWHRYTLRGEPPRGWVPPLHGAHALRYLGRSMGVGLVVAAAVLIIGIVAAPFAAVIGPGVMAGVVPVAGFFVGLVLFYRLGLALPAAAVDAPLNFGDAWRRTQGMTGPCAVLALLTAATALLLQVPTILDGPDAGAVTVIYQAVAGWISLMVGVGTLSALYGHLVEDWPVD